MFIHKLAPVKFKEHITINLNKEEDNLGSAINVSLFRNRHSVVSSNSD